MWNRHAGMKKDRLIPWIEIGLEPIFVTLFGDAWKVGFKLGHQLKVKNRCIKCPDFRTKRNLFDLARGHQAGPWTQACYKMILCCLAALALRKLGCGFSSVRFWLLSLILAFFSLHWWPVWQPMRQMRRSPINPLTNQLHFVFNNFLSLFSG